MEFSETQNHIFLPISIKLTNKKILVIGGGRIASHKINFLEQFTKNISVVALEVCDNIKAKGYSFKEKSYEKSDIEGAFLVYACSNIRELNHQIKLDAENLGILTNVVDNPGLCDFVSPAIYKRSHITIAVGSNGQEVRRAIAVRNKIREYMESDDEVFYKPIN
ncbi:MAG TPA: bifunctional precorrin-2 dehydrogenase/sirohydrochlorin ferrochelatase [Prolixibacteraceae bacterium]|nr:bifunctional precorrin-2 dehydrogenase/sirohydrochlorin ferrochelatase [Prolixibacteraceae bacterium]